MFRLDQLLRDRNITQSDLARSSGVSFATINRIAGNKTQGVELAVLDKLAKALGVHPRELLYRPLSTEEEALFRQQMSEAIERPATDKEWSLIAQLWAEGVLNGAVAREAPFKLRPDQPLLLRDLVLTIARQIRKLDKKPDLPDDLLAEQFDLRMARVEAKRKRGKR